MINTSIVFELYSFYHTLQKNQEGNEYFFENMQMYKEAKLKLFDCARAPIAILNGDDEVGREIGIMRAGHMLGNQPKQQCLKTVYYGLKTPSDAFAVITEDGLHGSRCMLNIDDELFRVNLALTGRYNVLNALAAARAATFSVS